MEDARKVARLCRQDPRVNVPVVDVERPAMVSFGLTRELARALGPAYRGWMNCRPIPWPRD